MFLHAGASLHGHEYSQRASSAAASAAPNLRPPPLLRSAFAPPKQRNLTADDAAVTPVRQRPASDCIPRDSSPMVRFRDPHDETQSALATHDESVSESELSEATFSIDGSTVVSKTRRHRNRRVLHKSTTYGLGYPTPRILGKTKVVQKVFLPRLLLQLQKVGSDGRTVPVLEVFPASRIAGPVVSPRLVKKCPNIFRVKRHLGYDDIVLVRRDDDDHASSDAAENESDENLEGKNLLAVYSPLKHSDEAEIVLHDGSVWLAKPLPNGCYDFMHTDAEGKTTTARWARRHNLSSTPTSGDSLGQAGAPQVRYTFSVLNPNTRRHPVMATLTPFSLEVQDTYTSVSPSHYRTPPITRTGRSASVTSVPPPTSPSTDLSVSPSPSSPDQRIIYAVDNATKFLIAATALWVALSENWSQNYGNSPAIVPGLGQGSSLTSSSAAALPLVNGSASSTTRSRRNTWTRGSTLDSVRQSDPGTTDPPSASSSVKFGSLKRFSLPAHQPAARCNSLRACISQPSTPLGSRTSTPVPGASPSVAANEGTPIVTPTIRAVPPLYAPKRATITGATFTPLREPSASDAAGGVVDDNSDDSGIGIAAIAPGTTTSMVADSAPRPEPAPPPALAPSATPTQITSTQKQQQQQQQQPLQLEGQQQGKTRRKRFSFPLSLTLHRASGSRSASAAATPTTPSSPAVVIVPGKKSVELNTAAMAFDVPSPMGMPNGLNGSGLAKKPSMRARISRWFQKLGPGSSSNAHTQ